MVSEMITIALVLVEIVYVFTNLGDEPLYGVVNEDGVLTYGTIKNISTNT